MKKYINWIIIFCIISLLLFIASEGLTDTLLWYDEAGQFWIAKGLYQYAAPYSTEGSLSEVLFYNQHYNKDPGGFGVLLHYWSYCLGNSSYILRLLPFLFFIASMLLAQKIAKQYLKNLGLQLLVLFVLCYLYAGLSSELRAYSMELCGVVLSTYLWHRYNKTQKDTYLILLCITLLCFCTSRYCFIIFAGVLTLRVLYNLVLAKQFTKCFFFGIPLLLMVLSIYFFQMRVQSAESGNLSYVPYLYSKPMQLFRGQLSYASIFGVFTFAYNYKKKKLSELNILAFFNILIFVMLSYANIFPWDQQRTFSLFVICVLNDVIFALSEFDKTMSRFLKTEYYTTMLIIIASVALVIKNIGLRDSENHKYYEEFSKIYNLDNGTIYVDLWMNPSIRYDFEYGTHKNYKDYPSRFSFGNEERHDQKIMEPGTVLLNHTNFDSNYYLMPYKKPKEQEFVLLEGYKYIYVRN